MTLLTLGAGAFRGPGLRALGAPRRASHRLRARSRRQRLLPGVQSSTRLQTTPSANRSCRVPSFPVTSSVRVARSTKAR